MKKWPRLFLLLGLLFGAFAPGQATCQIVQCVSPEDLPFIFNRSYRADKSRAEENGESGLGLAIVKALVEAHGGIVSVQSLPGAGLTFAITLPMQQSEATA